MMDRTATTSTVAEPATQARREKAPAWRRPLQHVARWRCEGDRYALPIEMWTARLLGRPERLS